jgi:hypothetical protein
VGALEVAVRVERQGGVVDESDVAVPVRVRYNDTLGTTITPHTCHR